MPRRALRNNSPRVTTLESLSPRLVMIRCRMFLLRLRLPRLLLRKMDRTMKRIMTRMTMRAPTKSKRTGFHGKEEETGWLADLGRTCMINR